MITYEEQRAALKSGYASSLARIVGCPSAELPPTVSRENAATFLELTNPKTLNVWKSTKRYPLVFVKLGRRYRVGSDSLINLLLDRAEIPEAGDAA